MASSIGRIALDRQIIAWLIAHPEQAQSVAQMAAALPGISKTAILRTCVLMRFQKILGRSGTGRPGSPQRFYVSVKPV